jgi:hypothetical protein
MHFMRNSIVIFIAVVAFVACKPSHHDIRAYYFPIESLDEGMIYEYASCRKDSQPGYYWLYKSEKTDGAIFLHSLRYDATKRLEQQVKEELVSNGTLAADYTLYEYTEKGDTLEIHPTFMNDEKAIFPFLVRDSTQGGSRFTFSLAWKNPTDTLEEARVVRNRYFNAFRTYRAPDGKTYDCVEMVTKSEQSSHHQLQGEIKVESVTIDHFAKNIGLVHTKTTFGKHTLEFYLKDRRKGTKL